MDDISSVRLIFQVLRRRPPYAEPDMTVQYDQVEVESRWLAALGVVAAGAPQELQQQQHIRSSFVFEADSANMFIECRASFSSDVYTSDQPIRVNVYLRNSSEQTIRASRLQVMMIDYSCMDVVIQMDKACCMHQLSFCNVFDLLESLSNFDNLNLVQKYAS